MHPGVQALLGFLESHGPSDGVDLAGPASARALAAVEDELLSPLPTDLRLLLGRHNGGRLPSATLLAAGADAAPQTILGVRALLSRRMSDVEPGDLPVPFLRTEDGAVLAFDRSGGPVPDTWPIIDYHLETGALRLVHRTFDGFCRFCLQEWTDPDFTAAFSLDKYLRSGERLAALEPDVSAAHATAAHAQRRAGRPEDALASYLRAARCLPSLPYCDWEALKIAALLGEADQALEAAQRLAARAPSARWQARETTPVRVAQALGWLKVPTAQRERVLRLLDTLHEQANTEDGAAAIQAVRRAVFAGTNAPPPKAVRPTAVPLSSDEHARFSALKAAYLGGKVRDEDLLLDPAYGGAHAEPPLCELLRVRREF